MKRLSFIIFLLTIFQCTYATTFYLSNSGNDSYSGTQQDSAWQTLNKLSNTTFSAGDSVLLASGETFRGQWNFHGKGTAVDEIFIGVYGGSTKAIINGAEPVTNWSTNSGNSNIYEADFSNFASQLIVNDQTKTIARYPNNGYLTIAQAFDIYSFVVNGITQQDSAYSGANIIVRKSDTYFERTKILDISGILIELQPYLSSVSKVGFGVYLDNKFIFMDTTDEWFADTSADRIYFQPGAMVNPNSLNIEASVYDYGINFSDSANYITIENIVFKNQTIAGLRTVKASVSINIHQNDFINQLKYGLYFQVSSTNSTFKQNNFENIKGIAFYNNQCYFDSIIQNRFYNIGMKAGYGDNTNFQYTAILAYYALHNRIIENTFDNIGGRVMEIDGNDNQFIKNCINHSIAVLANFGAVSFFGVNNYNCIFKKNIISNTQSNLAGTINLSALSSGLLLSNSCHDFICDSNVIMNTNGNGILVGLANHNHSITHNIIYNAAVSQICFSNLFGNPLSQTNNSVKHNQFISLSPNQYCYKVETDADTITYAITDSNYYFNPFNAVLFKETFNLFTDSAFITKDYTLRNWKLHTALDSSSKSSFTSMNNYSATDTIGNDLIANGNFTNNFNLWSAEPEDATEMLLDNSVGMDGGCIKFRILQPDSFGKLKSPGFDVSENELYKISYSIKTSKVSDYRVSAYKNSGGYNTNGYKRTYELGVGRKEISDVFKTSVFSDAENRIDFSLVYNDSVNWFDNIHLYHVNGFKNDTSRMCALYVNCSNNIYNNSLADSFFLDVDSNHVQSLLLKPFTAKVLFYVDTSTYTSVKNMVVNYSVECYPNPANDYIILNSDVQFNKSITIIIYDLQGKEIFKKDNNLFPIKINISELIPGLYFIKIIHKDFILHQSFIKS